RLDTESRETIATSPNGKVALPSGSHGLLTVYPGANRVSVRRAPDPGLSPSHPGTTPPARSATFGLSRKARLRLIEKLGQIRRDAVPLAVELTWPGGLEAVSGWDGDKPVGEALAVPPHKA